MTSPDRLALPTKLSLCDNVRVRGHTVWGDPPIVLVAGVTKLSLEG